MAEQACRYVQLSRTASQGYEVGLLSVVELLDAYAVYREGLRNYIRAEADFQRTRVELYWAVGRPLISEEE